MHVGGLDVDVVKTDSEGHARRYVEELEKLPQAILCAGGDGTLFEIVTGSMINSKIKVFLHKHSSIISLCYSVKYTTGLLRRPSRKDDVYPTIGLLPIGRTNLMGENMFNFKTSSKLDRARGLADASIAVVRGKTTRKDLMKIEVIEDQQNIKPVYAFSTFEWGAFRDAFNERDRYWYFGPLRDYVAFVFKAFDNDLSWNCAAELKYTEPCSGCSNCFVKPQQNERKQARRWWSSFIPSFRLGSSQSSNGPDYSKITNTNCAHTNSVQCQSAGILVTASNVECDIDEKAPPKLNIKLIKPTSSFDFVSDSWSRLNSRNISTEAEYAVRSVEIQPETKSEEEKPRYFYIDNESFEVKSIRITLLPKFINFYAPESQ